MQRIESSLQAASRRQFLRHCSSAAAASFFASRFAGGAETSGRPDLILRSADPLNGEPALARLVAGFVTPLDSFFVRNHGTIPAIDPAAFRLRVEGLIAKPRELSLAEIQGRFRQQTIEATLTCAGNRRQELSAIKSVSGVQWDAGAIGNARWTGATLAEILRAAELSENARHVWFEGLDPVKEKDGSVAPFGGSIPLARALAADAPVLLGQAMNDQPLTAEHGFPLRTVVPGFIGARSVKWLTKIVVSDRPSPNHYVAEAYKIIQTDSRDELAAAQPIYEFPLNAAICLPASGAQLKAGRTNIAGYALPTGKAGCRVTKVELSLDGGQRWIEAALQGREGEFTWQLWSAELDLPPGRQSLVVRASDSLGHQMPERGAWNAKGYLYNGWHRVTVEVG